MPTIQVDFLMTLIRGGGDPPDLEVMSGESSTLFHLHIEPTFSGSGPFKVRLTKVRTCCRQVLTLL